MQTPDEIIAVVTAFKNGEELEACAIGGTNWISTVNPAWNFYSYNYHVKPKPRVIYAQFLDDGTLCRTTLVKPDSNLDQWTKFTEDLS